MSFMGLLETESDKMLLVSDLWAASDYFRSNERYEKLYTLGGHGLASLIDGLTLYDKIIVPTEDFMVVPFLATFLGERGLIELLESGILSFAKVDGALAFATPSTRGGLSGIAAFKAFHKSIPSSLSNSEAFAACYDIHPHFHEGKKIFSLIEDSLKHVELNNLLVKSRTETDRDLANIRFSRALTPEEIRLGVISGVEWNKIIPFDHAKDWEKASDVSKVLQVAFYNVEAQLAIDLNCIAMSSLSPMKQIINARRALELGTYKGERFRSFSSWANLPNLPQAVVDNRVSVADLIKLRRSANLQAFQKRFHACSESDAKDLVKPYLDILQDTSLDLSGARRAMRFAALSSWGALEPVSSTVFQAINEIQRHEKSRTCPIKIFVDEIRRVGAAGRRRLSRKRKGEPK